MIDILNLNFNGNPVTSLSFNGSEVDSLIFNNTYQWSLGGEFKISPLLMQSTGEIFNVTISPSYPKNTNVYITGNHIMFCRTLNCLPKDITISSGNISFNKLAVDNYGMMLARIFTRGVWSGGQSGNNFNVNVTFGVKNSSCNKFNFISLIDENNICFLKDLFTTNVIRVPSTGLNNFSLNYYLYPFNFDSNLFSYDPTDPYDYSSDPIFYVCTIENDSRNMQAGITSISEIVNNTIFSEINLSNLGTTITLNCSIESNPTNNYREVVAIFGGTLVHFILEPYNQNRIYYNKYKVYYDSSIDYYSSETVFLEMESCILEDYYELTSTLDDYIILLPENLADRYDITETGGVLYPNTYSNDIYSWGGINYKCYGCGSNKLIFTKK